MLVHNLNLKYKCIVQLLVTMQLLKLESSIKLCLFYAMT
jgi:hypothetical protein